MPTLFKVTGLKKYFEVRTGGRISRTKSLVRAVDGVGLRLSEGETLSIVGESGCGKTTLCRMLLLLEKPTGGTVIFKDVDVHKLKGKDLSRYRASVQTVFQDPYGSLSPRLRVKSIIDEPLQACGSFSKVERSIRVMAALKQVGMNEDAMDRYPHEFSGGQRQRIALARALSTRPSVMILDEPVSALDVSVRANVMNLLKDLQAQYDMAYLLIAHDLATVRHMSDNIAVMYLGKIVEQAPSEEFYLEPLHPYGQSLLTAAASRGGLDCDASLLEGEIPSPINPPSGCHFHPRCPQAMDICREVAPESKDIHSNHMVSCHLY